MSRCLLVPLSAPVGRRPGRKIVVSKVPVMPSERGKGRYHWASAEPLNSAPGWSPCTASSVSSSSRMIAPGEARNASTSARTGARQTSTGPAQRRIRPQRNRGHLHRHRQSARGAGAPDHHADGPPHGDDARPPGRPPGDQAAPARDRRREGRARRSHGCPCPHRRRLRLFAQQGLPS